MLIDPETMFPGNEKAVVVRVLRMRGNLYAKGPSVYPAVSLGCLGAL